MNYIVFIALLISILWTWLSIQQMQKEKPLNEVTVNVYPQYRVISQQDLNIWPEGTVFEQSAAYFYTAKPLIEITPYLEVEDFQQGSLEGFLSPNLVLRSVNDKSESFWSYELPELSLKEYSFVMDSSQAYDRILLIEEPITLDITGAYEKATQISEEINYYGGIYQVVLSYSIQIRGTVNEIPMDKTMVQEVPMNLEQVSFSIPKTEEMNTQLTFTDNRDISTNMGRVENVIRTFSIQISITLILAILFVFLLLSGKSGTPKQMIEHRRFREWITEGSVNINSKYMIQIFTLEGLVDLAIDLDKRVIFNPETNKYYVLAEDMAYLYDPKRVKNKDNKQQLGKMLLELGLLKPEQLEIGLYYQDRIGRKLGESLIALGFIKEATLYSTLAAQFKQDYYEIDTSKDISSYDLRWLDKLSVDQARTLMVLPLGQRGDGKQVIASSEIYGESKIDVLQELFGNDLHMVMSRPSAIYEVLDQIASIEIMKMDMELSSIPPISNTVPSISEHEYKNFAKAYYRGHINYKILLTASSILAPTLYPQLPEDETDIKWLSDHIQIKQELLQLLLGLDKSVKSMDYHERQAHQLPDKLELLHNANFISSDTVEWMKKELKLQDKEMDRLFLEYIIVSDHILTELNRLLKAIENLLTKTFDK